ncbi:cell division protein ZapB [Streptomyces sp. NPDC052127]|uniref:cell division protein ZapB n=1 Tax=Streptomyces sp. NPDC052127 TaxID=3155679 RepID=UPI0034473662
MNRPALPDADTVRAAMDTVLAAAVARGRRPTLTAVERHLGLAHATFYRHYSDLITGYFQPRIPRPTAAADGGPAGADETAARTVRRLRQENTELRRTVEVYAEMIRQLAAENDALRQPSAVVRSLPARGDV